MLHEKYNFGSQGNTLWVKVFIRHRFVMMYYPRPWQLGWGSIKVCVFYCVRKGDTNTRVSIKGVPKFINNLKIEREEWTENVGYYRCT